MKRKSWTANNKNIYKKEKNFDDCLAMSFFVRSQVRMICITKLNIDQRGRDFQKKQQVELRFIYCVSF